MPREPQILESLDHAIRAPRVAAFLSSVTAEVRALLDGDATARLAWRTVPLDIYGHLPGGIASSWVFVLRAGCSSGAEAPQQHPTRDVV